MERFDPAAVCTLPPDALAERIAWIRDEILPHARSRERLTSGLAFELDAAPGLAAKLDRLVELERACCGGIVFERSEGSQPGRLRLEIRGVDPDAPILRDLAPPRGGAAPARLAKAGGIGLAAALAVCCSLPAVASLLVGGAAAASLARLDEPWAIALATLAASALAWRWIGRRSSAGPREGCGPAC